MARAVPTVRQRPRRQAAPSTSDRYDRKLTEVVKRLAIPRDIDHTDWGPIRDTCRDDMGIEFDRWQDGLGQLLLARNSDGLIAHTVGGFGLSGPRQFGKTFWGAGSLFGMCQHYPGLLVIWSAHHSTTHEETFMAMQGFAGRTKVAPFIEKVYTGSGDEEVRFWNGSRILFGARERGFGRGIPGVDVLFNDEGQILSERAMQNMLATLNTSWLGLHIYAGTPPKPEDNSELWMRMRDEAWVIEDPSITQTFTNDMVWCEMGADDGADLDDHEQWGKGNVSFPHRTPIQGIMRLRRKLNDDGFRREGLGLYDVNEGSIFNMPRWKTLIAEDVAEPERAALVIDVSPDQKWSCIAICSVIEAESEADEEKSLIMVMSFPGTAGAVAKAKELEASKDLIDFAITNGAARALETDLVKAGIEYEKITASEQAASYATLQKAIKDGTVMHVDQPELNFALANAKKRMLQTGEAEAFDRRDYSLDISPAVAGACALYRWGLLSEPLPFIG